MGKHGAPKWYHRVFLPCWEVVNTKDDTAERFRTNKGAQEYADDLNDPNLYDGGYDGRFYSVKMRSF
jgi:hypothetical protein